MHLRRCDAVVIVLDSVEELVERFNYTMKLVIEWGPNDYAQILFIINKVDLLDDAEENVRNELLRTKDILYNEVKHYGIKEICVSMPWFIRLKYLLLWCQSTGCSL